MNDNKLDEDDVYIPGELWSSLRQTSMTALQRLILALRRFWNILRRRVFPTCRLLWSGWGPLTRILLYLLVFALVTSSAVIALQLSVYSDSNARNTFEYLAKMWELQHYQFLLSCLIAGLFYLLLIFVLNRFWIATALFAAIAAVTATANYFKVLMRNEPIIPADLTFLKGDAGNIMSFIPDGYEGMVQGVTTTVIVIVVVCLLLHILDKHKPVIPMKRFKAVMIPLRIILASFTAFCLCFIGANLGAQGSWVQKTASSVFFDTPQLWDSLEDSRHNGPLVNFTRLLYNKAMDKPENYNEQTMTKLAKRYESIADDINANRTADLTDSTVIMILSETFSDPTRVPGVSFLNDPMPNIREIKQNTTSGLMLSPGYGGGTANIEYQALTGLSLSNFDPSMAVPYQQLVSKLKWTPTFNQIWNERNGSQGSIAMHPFYRSMYLRDTNYRKFGFSEFSTLDGSHILKYRGTTDASPYVNDVEAYRNILDAIHSSDNTQFIQMVTMQNHMPYSNWYADNEFVATDTSGLPEAERAQIDTYAKGVSLTDQATLDFLHQLNDIDRPITVIFYGDHLPGIYSTADKDKSNTLQLHETDYFIWSNQASSSATTKLPESSTSYTSSNYFMAQAAEHMNAKVSPYLAMLTKLHDSVAVVSTVIARNGGIGLGEATYLDNHGNRLNQDSLSKRQQRLLNDYRLVQYDMTIGKGYLKDLDFVDVP